MIFLGLGANLPSRFGSPEDTIYKAYELLERQGLEILKASHIWYSAPVPFDPNQPWFCNSVISISTTKTPLRLLQILLKVESEIGRVRTIRNAPRVIDLDLLSYDSLCCDIPKLTLPHPRMHARAFVLNPLQQIAPKWVHPRTGESLDKLISLIPDHQQAFLEKPFNNDEAKQGKASKASQTV